MGRFIKQGAPYITGGRYLQGIADTIIGGQLTSVPSGVSASQNLQNIPGDIFYIDTNLALALSDTSIGTLYGGFYRYVKTAAGSVATPARGLLAFWDTSVADNLYQVMPDETGSQGANILAGIYIGALPKGDYGIIQIGGKVSVKFRSVLTGIPANGCGVYAAAAGAGGDVATCDVFSGDLNNTTFDDMQTLQMRFLGTALAIPVLSAISTVAMRSPILNRA